MNPQPGSTYSLLLTQQPDGKGAAKAVGENVFLENLPADYKVYVFYYPGTTPNEELVKKLRSFGEAGGKNVFVNFSSLDDPRFSEMISRFQIEGLPAIIVTAIEGLAAPADADLTVFARLDNRQLLDSPDRVTNLVQELFMLFLQGKVKEAMDRSKSKQRTEFLRTIGGFFGSALKGIKDFILDRDISISALQGKFELKKHGG